MARIKAGESPSAQIPRSRGRFVVNVGKNGVHAQAWPKKRGAASEGYNLYKQLEFALVASWAANPEPIALQTAMELSKDSDNVPRDLLMMVSYGTFYEIVLPDGTRPTSYRMVAPNAQLILDQVTDEPGSLLWRAPIGWVQIAPGNNGDVLTINQTIPNWAPNGIAPGTVFSTPANQPNFRNSNFYLGPLGAGATSAASQALTANTLYLVPLPLPERRTITSLAVKVTAGAVGSSVRLGVYNNDGDEGGPGTLAIDGGAIATNTPGLKALTTSVLLEPGLYWGAIWSSGTPTIHAQGPSVSFVGCGWDMSLATPACAKFLQLALAFGTNFPDLSSTALAVPATTTNVPIIGIR